MFKLNVVGPIPEELRNLTHLTTLYELSTLFLPGRGHVCLTLRSFCVLSLPLRCHISLAVLLGFLSDGTSFNLAITVIYLSVTVTIISRMLCN
jgi:hypothetical protein